MDRWEVERAVQKGVSDALKAERRRQERQRQIPTPSIYEGSGFPWHWAIWAVGLTILGVVLFFGYRFVTMEL
ncbi:hypothetical protein Q5762_31310 [Streptomyces sp. P9(2023)]|uniref:hypothetical protein n=1 Tax=Streptomyces sp. P9(2023) TaxID=3064394 RepID=UPI0028F4030A|nr:hypothetical protein [Streptomyces sp. P9(2023)]MDT9692738.1 hypothetical protein [Streptomyces sp. P9(2023)]